MAYCSVCDKELTDGSIYFSAEFGKLCAKHYQQLIRYDRFLDDIPRTTFDRNDYEIKDDYVIIHIYNKKQDIVADTLIDLEDLDRIISYKWRLWRGYIFTGNEHPVQLHRMVLNYYGELAVDHINGDRLDNRKANLRICSVAKNNINKALQSNNTSGITGVCFDKSRNKWAVEIHLDGIGCHLGRYKTLQEACYCRYIAEIILFKEYRSSRNDEYIMSIVHGYENDKIRTYAENKIKAKFGDKY